MTRDVATLSDLLAKSPEDWSLRLTLIEEKIRADDTEAARELVRTSPDSSPLPVELQYRLHSLMTRGKDALEPLPKSQEPAQEVAAPNEMSEVPKDVIQPVPPADAKPASEEVTPPQKAKASDRKTPVPVPPAGSKPENKSSTPVPVPPAKSRISENPEPVAPASPEPKPQSVAASEPQRKNNALPDLDEIGPIKDGAKKSDLKPDSKLEKPKPKDEIKLTVNQDAQRKWEEYSGKFLLTEAGDHDFHAHTPAKSKAADKLSALTLAIIFHLAVLLPLAFVVIAKNRPNPPQLIVSTVVEKELDLKVAKISKTKEKRLSAAAAQTVNLLSTTGPSAMKIPEMEESINTEFTSFVPGIEPTGMGMSFTGMRDERSDVNFFGISGGGDRVVFVVDATKPMLVDEKGGMFAYDKVKSEIAAMLNELRRGTQFNILLYDGKTLVAFQEKPVPGLPSNRRKAVEWLDPLNRDYDNLGLRNGYMVNQIQVEESDIEPIQARDIAHYAKAIQKALEWKASAVFCISAGYLQINRSPSAEMIAEYKDKPVTPGTPGKVSPAEQKKWQEAQKKTREWLTNENAARKEKGLPPKVVTNFNRLVAEVTGQSPPRPTGGTPATGGIPRQPPHTPEDIELQVKNLVKAHFDDEGREKPSVHMVLFLGEEEEIGDREDHFKTLTRKNRGKLKILRGLAALDDVTG